MLRINFIGCGQLGQTLGSLWQQQHLLTIGDVLTRSADSAAQAVKQIGAGRAISSIQDMQAADIYMLACGDDAIESCSQTLADSQLIQPGNSVFHCSGAQSSQLLHACQSQGALIASIHPIKSFADITLAAQSFSGTYCGVEGDEAALATLSPLFTETGAKLLPILAEHKTLYHAASVIACNYLVALEELSIQAFEQAGIERQQALAILQPIVTGTVENIFNLGTVTALTGPISRGDHSVVTKQLAAMEDWNPDYATVYRQLAKIAVPLSQQQGNASAASLREILGSLNSD
ncbi:Rossmann-like and DUF2520 domain-containing protein [Leucothrix pacifica]|uniref:DUF2520 domain-containing protein n=1 Tax=Leucothrix pacifica TaxID=1247513 RepID=A0A317CD47_9GAMM|nr:Rossmann-like and DUF2520 domain-containing protein [Leucothrix pacifica]PWQ96564.1 DUF2520 domain-containing protein [Leucothrix pacifica]